jgi:hypothetical protein
MYPASRTHGLFITYTQSFISMIYTRLARYIGGACPNPFDNPLLLGNAFLIPWTPLLLTWNPSSVPWCNPCLLWSLVGCILSPPPLSYPFPFPFPQQFPFSNACPPTTTLRYRLHIVRYNNILTLSSIYAYISWLISSLDRLHT